MQRSASKQELSVAIPGPLPLELWLQVLAFFGSQ